MHWGLVLAVAGAWASQELDDIPFQVHLYCGYAVLLIVALRILWGFFGTRHARFAAFLRGPGAVLDYARALLGGRDARTAGHNPLGALMIVLLLALLLAQALTGLFTNDEIFDTGPLFGYVSSELSKRLTTLHKQIFDYLLAAIALHVTAALFYLWVKRENLILPMITGYKHPAEVPPAERIGSSRVALAALLLAGLAGILYWVVSTAPPSDPFAF
jgi:cytochrome b